MHAAVNNNTTAINALVNVLGPLGVAIAGMAPPAAALAAPVVDFFLDRLKPEFRHETSATTWPRARDGRSPPGS